MKKNGKREILPFINRHPWYFFVFVFIVVIWFMSSYALKEAYLPSFLTEERGGQQVPTLLAGIIWFLWTIFLLGVSKWVRDPMAWKLPHAQLMIPAMEELVESYERDRRDVILARLDRAGDMGFRGGRGTAKFEIARFSILKVREHSKKNIDEVRRFQSVRPQDKLRSNYYNVASRIDAKEILCRRIDRFLRSQGVDPEEVAPSRPSTD